MLSNAYCAPHVVDSGVERRVTKHRVECRLMPVANSLSTDEPDSVIRDKVGVVCKAYRHLITPYYCPGGIEVEDRFSNCVVHGYLSALIVELDRKPDVIWSFIRKLAWTILNGHLGQ